MIKKIVLLFNLFMLLSVPFISLAETCPSVGEIKASQYRQWSAFDIDNGTPVPASQLPQFEKKVTMFSLAEWMQDAPEGSAHCYYTGHGSHADYLGVFLAKSALVPNRAAGGWQSAGPHVMQCYPAKNSCEFMSAMFDY